MKKITALFMAILLVFALFACSNSSGTTSPSASAAPSSSVSVPSASASASPSAPAASATPSASPSASTAATSPKASAPASTVKLFDPTFDYSKNGKFKIACMQYATASNNDSFSEGLKHWASVTNCDYQVWSANFDDDAYINALSTIAATGVNGYVVDTNPALFGRADEICRELKMPYTGGLGSIVDANNKLLTPCAGFDNTACGQQMADWMMDYAKTTWKITDFSKVGYISLDFSLSAQIHERTTGAKNAWLKANPTLEKNFFYGDGAVTMKLDNQTAFDDVAAIMSSHSDLKYWLVSGCVDEYANGAARAAESLGKQDTTVTSTVNAGAGLMAQWDHGDTSAWKAAITCAPMYNTEFVYFGLYDMMKGTKAESLWPEWIDHSTGQKYAYLQLPTVIITHENYKDYMEWVDKVTGTNLSNYPYSGAQFTAMLTPSASFSQPAAAAPSKTAAPSASK